MDEYEKLKAMRKEIDEKIKKIEAEQIIISENVKLDFGKKSVYIKC